MTATTLKRRIRAYRKVQALWKQACEYEGIEPTAQFVCWSEDNPHYEAYQKAINTYLVLCDKKGDTR